MKKQNSNDLLNRILLQIKYDSSKTLSENALLFEQGSVDRESKVQAIGKDVSDSWDIETEFIETPFGEIKVPVGTKVIRTEPDYMKASSFQNCKNYDPNFPPGEGDYGTSIYDGKKIRRYCPTDDFIEDWFSKNGYFFGFTTPDKLTWTVVITKQQGLPQSEFIKITSAPELFKNTQFKNSRGWTVTGFYNCLGDETFRKCIPYDDDIMTPKSFTEKYLPILLSVGSVIISLIPGVGWIGLAIAIGMDLAAAGIQGYYGDTLGAGISVLLSLVPFVGMFKGVAKFPDSIYNSLAQKFSKAVTEDDVIRIFASLDNPLERKAMADLLTNPGIIQQANWQSKLATELNQTSKNKILGFLKNKDKADEIIKMTKELNKTGKISSESIPLWATTGMKSAAVELGISAPLIAIDYNRTSDNKSKDELEQEYQNQKIVQGVLQDIKNENNTTVIVPASKEDRINALSSLDSIRNVRNTEQIKKTDSVNNEINKSITSFWDE